MTTLASPAAGVGARRWDGPARAMAAAGRGARYAGVFLRGQRRLTLPGLAAAGCLAGAGFTINATTGLIVSAASLLAIDWKLTGGADEQRDDQRHS